MGLEKYQTKDLVLNLLYPTLVVIITVVQLQIFHKKYLTMMKFTMINQRFVGLSYSHMTRFNRTHLTNAHTETSAVNREWFHRRA